MMLGAKNEPSEPVAEFVDVDVDVDVVVDGVYVNATPQVLTARSKESARRGRGWRPPAAGAGR
jgi:hypothetical protein